MAVGQSERFSVVLMVISGLDPGLSGFLLKAYLVRDCSTIR